jgi:hypothetical protein
VARLVGLQKATVLVVEDDPHASPTTAALPAALFGITL